MAEVLADFGPLRSLATDLGARSFETVLNVRQAVEVSSRSAKDHWREDAAGPSGEHARRYPQSIDYDINVQQEQVGNVGITTSQVEGVIGPNLGKPQGALGILDEAPGGVRSAPQNAARKALAAVQDDFQAGIAKAVAPL